ncbi:MAG TPA: hypothetical protein VEC35_01010 [Noviherbaspirillum sp.]|nr:hypothetical protein [Noviherbaspirillum sp.]
MTTDKQMERERAEFEDAYKERFPCMISSMHKFDRDADGDYRGSSVFAAWEMWQAARRSQGREVPEGQSVHEWFGLTYAQFLTLPRVIMEAMPMEWQLKMTVLLDEMDAAFDWLPASGNMYYVRVGKPIEWPYEDDDGNPIEPTLQEPDADLCNYRRPRIEHRRKIATGPGEGRENPTMVPFSNQPIQKKNGST